MAATSDSNTPPLVSVGVPVYNGGATIAKALEGLLSQDYEGFEIIISDNGSTDETAFICKQYANRDSRIRYYRSERNMGAIWNFNRVFELSRGEYFFWAAADDNRASSFIRCCLATLERSPSAVLCYPIVWLEQPDGDRKQALATLKADQQDAHHRFRSLMCCPENWSTAVYGLIRSESLRRTGLLQNYLGSDFGLLFELTLYGTFVHCPNTEFYYRLKSPDKNWPERTWAILHPANKPRRWRLYVVEFGIQLLRIVHRASIPRPLRARLIAGIVRSYFLGWTVRTAWNLVDSTLRLGAIKRFFRRRIGSKRV